MRIHIHSRPLLPALNNGPLPRAVANGVRAETDTAALLRQIQAAQRERNTADAARFDGIEAVLNDHAMRMGARDMMAGGGAALADPEYTTAFASYFRTGDSEADLRTAHASGDRRAIMAALSEDGAQSDGGYLAPAEWDRRVISSLVGRSPIRRLANVKKTKVGKYSTLWKLTGPGSGWVGETASRPATTTPTFAPLLFGHGEIYANAFATQRILDDAGFDLAAWLTGEVEEEFGKQEAITFVVGDGVNKPFGILGHVAGGAHAAIHPAGAIETSQSGAAATLTVDGLIDFTYALPAPYRANSTWVMNSKTAATIAKMKDGQGNLIWRESLIVGQPSTLLGRPVELDDNLPDVAAGALPIIFGDFRAGYLINDREPGMRILRDPYTNKPYVGFYCTRRVGGGVLDPKALRVLKIGVS